mgnify:CR=1 FL=1
MIELTDANFQAEVMKSKLPVLVDFWAPWCGPCKTMNPIVEEVASHFEGKIKVAKMNVDEHSQTPGTFGVLSIPTFVLVKSGVVAEQIVGALSKSQLTAKIERILGD